MRSLSLIVLAALALGASESASATSAAKPYPLTTCIVTDEALGSMGAPFVLVHEGQEVKLCCKGCLRRFRKDPAVYLKKLPAGSATAAAKPA